MNRIARGAEQKAHLIPGSLVHIGERRMDAPKVTLMSFDATSYDEVAFTDLADCARPAPGRISWINVDGIHQSQAVEALGQMFGLHPLVLEDIMNAGQRPKVEEYDDCLFVVLKMIDFDAEHEKVMVEQVSFVLGKDFVITFQERSGDVFDGVRDRVRTAKGRIRKSGADYLLYALLDAMVDEYFVALEALSDYIEDLEARLADDPYKIDANELHVLRRETLFLRRNILPAREVMAFLARAEEESDLINQTTGLYLRDVQDHIMRCIENIEVMRDLISSLLDLYHAALSNRMNEIMKVLAMISTIFIPLSFIAGVYGMNFAHMPELHWWLGYPAILLFMALVAGGLVVYFKTRRWF